MNHTALRLIVLVLITIAPRAAAQAAPGGLADQASPGAVRLPGYFYKRLTGEIDPGRPIVMNLMREGKVVRGDYYFLRAGTPISFTADSGIAGDGTFTLQGRTTGVDAVDDQSGGGSFKGRFTSDHAASGTWTSPDGATSSPFTLTESYPAGSARFEVTRAARDWVAERGEASIEVLYPVMRSAEHPSTAARINAQLFSTLLGGYDFRARLPAAPTVGALLDDFISRFLDEAHSADLPEGYAPMWEDLLEASVSFNGGGILGIKNTIFTFEGGAHPTTTYLLANYDVATGAPIELSDILKAGYKEKLDALGEAALRKKYNVPADESLSQAHFFVKEGAFELPDNFLVTAGGLEFQFNQYEIAPYFFGSPLLFIAYSELRDLIRPNGPLAQFAR